MRHKDPELMNRIKQYISEYYLENAGAMPTITQIASAMKIVRSTLTHISWLWTGRD